MSDQVAARWARVPAVLPGRRTTAIRATAAVAGVAVLLQVAYPLLDGATLRVVTVAAVAAFALASTAHAGLTLDRRAAVVLPVTAGGLGLLAETLGVRTGFPFGDYRYAASLGPQLLGVPLVVPLAWVMMAYPCLLAGRRLAGPRGTGTGTRRQRLVTTAVGGWTLAAWDLYLDPQMVAAGHWVWAQPDLTLPGVPHVPVSNYLGWLAVSVVIVAALDRLLPRPGPAAGHREGVPAALLAWTWAGSAIGNLVFFGRPWVAFYGGVAMGVTVLPYLRAVLRDRG